MATLQIENLPDELYSRIQCLASENNFTLNEAVIHLLKQSFESDKVMINQAQESNPMSAILQRIRSRSRVNPSDFGLMDSTVLIQEDRNR
jgi:plasmid stability protein